MEFSNDRPHTQFGWQPWYDLRTGAAITPWLEFANDLTAKDLTGAWLGRSINPSPRTHNIELHHGVLGVARHGVLIT
jgi:hypothetical protein